MPLVEIRSEESENVVFCSHLYQGWSLNTMYRPEYRVTEFSLRKRCMLCGVGISHTVDELWIAMWQSIGHAIGQAHVMRPPVMWVSEV